MIRKSLKFFQTAERVSSSDPSDSFVFQRSLLAYVYASQQIQGHVLEIGTGSGYGIHNITEKATHFVTIDKNSIDKSLFSGKKNCSFIQMKVPPFKGINSNSFDYIICFQVLEHIKKDQFFIQEIKRVLKPNGIIILTTPNKKMSLSRNPWHIREYTCNELTELINRELQVVQSLGVFGNDRITSYYEKNKKAVNKYRKYDVFNLEHRLPRWLLQKPYDILNRINRKQLLKKNRSILEQISLDDYYIDNANDNCYDLLYFAKKSS
ncbi:MAG: methyltransferase domain-containing protein [Flavobacteriia bacterium]|nr:methyltransferase domain-containing protein [Flavobacteriia bacterium]